MRSNQQTRMHPFTERNHATLRHRRRAFTLVELVVVILVIGIIAAVAAPRAINTSDSARDESAENSLNVIRDALELYRAENNGYPNITDEAGFTAALDAYLMNNGFPICPVGNKNNNVRVSTSGTPLNASGSEGWAYDAMTAEFIINHASYSNL